MNRNFYTPKKFTNEKIIMGFFTKNGGSSKKNYSSLNCSFNSGDKINIVSRNESNEYTAWTRDAISGLSTTPIVQRTKSLKSKSYDGQII